MYVWGILLLVLQIDVANFALKERMADEPEITSLDTVLREGVFSWQQSMFLHD